MKIKTSDLTGVALGWGVAKANQAVGLVKSDPMLDCMQYFTPSTSWSHGGPIIEREKIDVVYCPGDAAWRASMDMREESHEQYGPTPLIAAMRCYVASKLGDEVEVPEELL